MIIGIDGNEANLKNRVGVNQYAAEVLVALEKLPDAKKHSFIVYLRQPPLSHLPKERGGWKYIILPSCAMWIITRLLLHLWFAKERPRVLFTPSHYTPLIVPMPTVVSIMDLGYLNSRQQFRKYDFYQLKYWGALSMRFAKKIIAISKNTKREISQNYSWAKGKIEVTYPAYDKKKFFPKIAKSKIDSVFRKYQIDKDYILFLSTLKPSKNIEGLIDAFNIISKNNDLKLIIVGKKGWLFETIFKKVQDLDLEKKVVFTDFIPEEDKAPLLAGAKVFAAPSFWEGFGMHVLEAMACGTPVVVSNAGSLPEVVGNAGVLVDPKDVKSIADGLEKALKMHNDLSKSGIVQAKKFNWEETAGRTLEILTQVA